VRSRAAIYTLSRIATYATFRDARGGPIDRGL
jgi:hypothetical protein